MSIPRRILPVIVLSQFFCTSLWFAGNAVMNGLVRDFKLQSSALGHLTASVQFGFVIGTLTFALLMISDRISPSRVYFGSAIIAAIFNLCIILEQNTFGSLLALRFMTGFFLAGIYPVGMKIAADYFQKGLGKSLGFLVGALVVGTAFPHLLKAYFNELPWKLVLITTSSIATLGGVLLIVLVPDGPNRTISRKLNLSGFFIVFKNRNFRSAAYGYFGHMWELYAFWAFVPIILLNYQRTHPDIQLSIPVLSFLVIASGGAACVIGAWLSEYFGTKRIAGIALLLSGMCCLLSPLIFTLESKTAFLCFLVFWGMVVVADSPMFSTLVANNAQSESKGTALTLINCIGFSITILSIQLLNLLQGVLNPLNIYLVLAIGPIVGLIGLYKRPRNRI